MTLPLSEALATCNRCGESVRWAKNPHTGRMVALEPVNVAYVVDASNRAQWTTVYDSHTCDPEVAVAYADRMADAAEMSRLVEEHRTRLVEAAMDYDCGRCGAEAATMCWNLTKRKTGARVHTRYPHPDRMPEPKRIEIEKMSPLFKEKYEHG